MYRYLYNRAWGSITAVIIDLGIDNYRLGFVYTVALTKRDSPSYLS